jgi:3-oxoacyl-[acyl-carrier-protein] synthase II
MEDVRKFGTVAQLVRALPCHGRGRGFEPRQSRKSLGKGASIEAPFLLVTIMQEVVCTGIALRSALGDLGQSWHGLLHNRTGIKMQRPLANLPALPLATIDSLDSQPKPRLSSLTEDLTASLLVNAGWTQPIDCAVVVGSSRSYQTTWEEFARCHVAERALDYLPHMPAIAVARQVGSQGAVLAPMAACATGIWSIERGYQLVASGQVARAIVGAVEAPIGPLSIVGFRQMGVLAKDGCYPFDRQRQGLVLGEGGALLALERRDVAEARAARIYGRILGAAMTNDAAHPWGVGGGAGAEAVQRCLAYSGLSAQDIDYIHLHGTATQLNDAYEATLVDRFFPGLPVSGSKGAIGHTLGAASAIGAAFTLLALYYQTLPPSVGCHDLAFEYLNLVRYGSTRPGGSARPSPLRQAICWSFGFGGQNAVLALGLYNMTQN